MRLRPVLDEARHRYLDAYRGALRAYRERFKPAAPEVLFQLSDKSDAAFIHRIYRADLASGAVTPPNVTEVNLEEYPSFEPFTEQHESGLTISVAPFWWNGLEVAAAGFGPDSESLRAWCWKWLDLDERFSPDEDGLSGVIHSVLLTSAGAAECSLSVDCGSAPLQALDELFALLRGQGVTHVWLATKTITDDET